MALNNLFYCNFMINVLSMEFSEIKKNLFLK